jgi:hypothetical protein
VAQLWPLLFARYGLEINFAHRTFAWGSDARGKAHVHVVIIGLSRRELEWPEKRLFSYDDINGDPVESRHRALSPYLFDASGLRDRHLVVEERSSPIGDAPKMITGSKPIDGGYYIFSQEEKAAFIAKEPSAATFMHPFVGAEEYINGDMRWILALQEARPELLRSMPLVKERIQDVARFRLGQIPPHNAANRPTQKRSAVTVALAEAPTKYHVNVIPVQPFLVVPQTSSQARHYVPIGWLESPIIPSDKLRLISDADLWQFGILTSAMHMAWMRAITGRMKSDYMYSVGVVYNNFPWPEVSEAQKDKIRALAQAVLEARAKYPGATLADLYDPDTMPADLRKAHHKLDDAVDGLYKRGGFASDRERVEHLFMLYEKLVAPLEAASGKTGKGRRK